RMGFCCLLDRFHRMNIRRRSPKTKKARYLASGGFPPGCYHCHMAPLIEAHDLRIRFGAAEAVCGIDLHIDDGEVLGLVGESGSGKSATALAILGLLGLSATVTGRILWRGNGDAEPLNLLDQPLSALRRIRGREIAMI